MPDEDTPDFFARPILNSPYTYPDRHWELDEKGQPTHQVVDYRRPASFVTPIPKPKRTRKKKRGKSEEETESLEFAEGADGISSTDQAYDITGTINAIRTEVRKWRLISDPIKWGVTAETARLLQHWRHHDFSGIRPFFCQLEAVEVAVWLTEVAPRTESGKQFLHLLHDANEGANPGMPRLALKLATGAGKTTVMAMLIAWQTINAVRHPTSPRYSKGFLIVAPGITIRDRLRVLLPNDPDSYYKGREIVPQDMLRELEQAKVIITNYHAFKLRETMELSKGNRELLQGRTGEEIKTTETPGQMIQRVMPELMGMKGVVVFNDEAHHCYREKPEEASDEEKLTGDDKNDAEENSKAARLWLTGLEMVKDTLGLKRIFDLSATPFFLSGSGYVEGTLFPWVMSDFSLMDAIECGIVKLPRVPIADNLPRNEMPMYRNLWEHIGKDMPKGRRSKSEAADPKALPTALYTALDALYGHYEQTFEEWKKAGIKVPPCFIVVCNNTKSSELVYKYISGYHRTREDGSEDFHQGSLKHFQNYNEHGDPLARPRTLLIDSVQLESGEALDKNFRAAAGEELERFKREKIERTGDRRAAENITDEELLREVMNTVGKREQLGGEIRCVVSVSMLTEGWDANTVTHVLGVRAFGTQLLCEQVVGRALRRQSYDLNTNGRFDAEYADVLGIPFDFTAEPVVSKPARPKESVAVKAIKPDRNEEEIVFPRVSGYRIQLQREKIDATFTDDSTLVLTPDLVGPTINKQSGIIGEQVDLTIQHLEDVRQSTLIYNLTQFLLNDKYRDDDGAPKLHLFGDLKKVVRRWLDTHLECKGGTYPAQLMYRELAHMATERINAGINRFYVGERPILAVTDPYQPIGTTASVNFATTKSELWTTVPNRCQVNYAVLDSDWEGEFCRIAETHSRVRRYVKNQGMGFSVPYRMGGIEKKYIPDYIVQIDDGHGEDDLLNLIVEIKGYRKEDAKVKKETMEVYWVPGVNQLGMHGRWAFAELADLYDMNDDFENEVERFFNTMIDGAIQAGAAPTTTDAATTTPPPDGTDT